MTDQIFQFESDFAGSLRCIPMAVRLKLDLVGIKVSLRQWSQLGRNQREALLLEACATPSERGAYADRLEAMLAASDTAIERIEPSSGAVWTAVDEVPSVVRDQALSKQVSVPTLEQWRALTPLQRFTLLKLTREGHENENFVPAMREFGLLS